MRKLLPRLVLALGVTAAAAVPQFAGAQQLLTIKGEKVNMRAAPSLRSDVLWQLGRNYPVKVVQRKGSWVKVIDFEGDRGWIAKRLTATTPHYVVKSPRANLRAGAGTKHRVIGQAQYGDVFRVLEQRRGWVRVRGEDARTGWIARGLLWGW
ncbi:SH3 domain-containing protein [Ramlibacter sp. AN1015]|uniref:SH3 domain-containing protein n=1 Tax=Ramlibacter sp. AN1015 TaxID=3133428 RepID=UPI0030BB056A